MLRYFIVVKIMSLLAISLCQADEVYDQSVIVQVNQYLASNACVEKCTLQTQSSGIGMDVDLTRLIIDLNSDGEPDYILSSRDNCGASNCIDALLASNNKKLIKVFEGQGIAYFSQSTNGFRDLVQGKRGPGQPSYGGTGKIPVYRWNGERYIESGTIDDQTSSVTSIHTDIDNTSQNIKNFSSEPDITIKQGQNKSGFKLTSLGESYYSGQQLFPRWTHGGQNIQLTVYKSLNSERALVQLWDYDWGGLRLALVDLLNNKILNNKFIPDESVISLGKPNQVKWIGNDVTWSPDGRFAALQYIFAEHEADLAVINLKNGFFEIFPTKSSNKVFSVPNLEKLKWQSDDTISVELFQLKCRNNLCEELVEETNNKTLSFSLSALVNKSTQHNQYGTDPNIASDKLYTTKIIELHPVKPEKIPAEELEIDSTQGHLALMTVLKQERNKLRQDSRFRFPNDSCYYGAISAGAVGSTQAFVAEAINELAVDITLAGLGNIKLDSELADAIMKFALDVGGAYFKKNNLTIEGAKSLVEKSIGYILTVWVKDGYNEISQSIFKESIKNSAKGLTTQATDAVFKKEGVIAGSSLGTNAKQQADIANGATITKGVIKWFYSPKTHYLSAFLSAECGTDNSGLYLIRFQVEKIFIFGVRPKYETLEILQLGAK